MINKNYKLQIHKDTQKSFKWKTFQSKETNFPITNKWLGNKDRILSQAVMHAPIWFWSRLGHGLSSLHQRWM